MSRELQQPPVPISLVKIEHPTVIKNEPSESEIVEIFIDDILDSSESEEEIIPDVKGIDIVYHPVCEEHIKSEILESKHCESVETRVFVKAEDSPFIETENITQRNKTKDTSDENVTKGTGQAVVEIQASNKHSNALSNLETEEQCVLNFSESLNGVRSRKSKSPKKTDFETTLWEKEKDKIKVIKASVIPVEAHEYTSLAKDKYVCNHCQRACNNLCNLKLHINKMHREATTMYQCPYCPYKSKWNQCIINKHIILKHKDTKDIQWFRCNLCEMKFKLKGTLTQHMKVHLRHKQMKDGLDLREKRYHCDTCSHKTYTSTTLKRHNLVHLKPEEIEYFHCYHCSYKFKHKFDLRNHIFRRHFKNVKQGKRYGCNRCDYNTYASAKLKRHILVHLKPEEIEYFYCYHCSYKTKWKDNLKKHIFKQHFKNVIKQGKRYGCNKCNYKTYISTQLKKHNLVHLKPKEVRLFYCYHCSHKATRKDNLQKHIFRHFKKEQVEFDCYICNFVTSKRESIIKHMKQHSKVQNKSEINEGS